MRNLLALLGAATLTFVGLGWYLDWYKIERKPSPVAGTQRLEINLNSHKVGTDVVNGGKRVGELIEHLSDKDGNAPTTSKPANENKSSEESKPTSRDTHN